MSGPTSTPSDAPQKHNFAKLFAGAKEYELLAGGWPARIGDNIIANLPVPITSSSVILDNACGSGAQTTAILKAIDVESTRPTIHAVDLSPGMIDYVTELYKDEPNVKTGIMNSQDLQFADNTFTHIINSFGVFFCPDYDLAIREMYRVLAPGGTTVITSWKVVGWTPIINYAVQQIRPGQEEYIFPAPPGFENGEFLKERIEAAGYKDVEIREVQDYSWQADIGETARRMMWMVKTVVEGWTEEELARWPATFVEAVEALGVERDADGGWRIDMTALVATGRK